MEAIFAGSFDPFTLGHREIVERALTVFDRIIVAVADDTDKNTAPLDFRVEMARASILDLCQAEAMGFSGLTTDFCKKNGIYILLRGLRGAEDFEYEKHLASIYKKTQGIEIVYMISELPHISSSLVRGLAREGRPLCGLVSGQIFDKVLEIYKG